MSLPFGQLSPEQEYSYNVFMAKYEATFAKYVFTFGSLYMLGFSFLELERGEDLITIAFCRGMAISLMGGAAFYFIRVKRIDFKTTHALTLAIGSLIVLLQFLKDYITTIVPYSLPNALVTYFYIYNAVLGYTFRKKAFQTLIFLATFILYSNSLSRFSDFHQGQVVNIFINGTTALMIGCLIERYKKSNYLRQLDLLASQGKIKKLDQLKTSLISMLSHDLRSPLNALRGLVGLVNEGNMTQDEFNYISKSIKLSIQNLCSMMDDMLQWSRLQMTGFNPVSEKLNVRTTLNQIIGTLKAIADVKRITIDNQIDKEMMIDFDAEILKLVSRNFLTNSIKFSHAGSSVIVNCKSGTNQFTMEYKDFGIGISRDKLEKLFFPMNGPSKGTHNEVGTGLGLTITKEFIEMVKGEVIVKSVEGRGTSFLVTFPVIRSN